MKTGISIPRRKIERFCMENKIKCLALFGSVLREDFSPSSDVDILVEFQADARVGLSFFRMEQELTTLFGRKVDLNTPGFISKDFLPQVLAEMEILYDASR
ncbi:MAG TPA: nucleotidyltransferase domain-containing protein [Thermotogota bacterium]|nr:nucleotidyltransferase domain-containing protein [Thermotogota bacterium]HRW92136.1 nucleotidyltransferase domain-containing protein [Thermotogota bacterium]